MQEEGGQFRRDMGCEGGRGQCRREGDSENPQVVAEMGSSGYDATQFSLSLSLPICLGIRQHSLWLHLEER